MASRDAIIAFADELLDVSSYPDYGPMGLQVVGADEVTTVACGVSASRELFEHAAAIGAELARWSITGSSGTQTRGRRHADEERLRALFDANITLAAYHLALDAHLEIGNNALLARELGVEVEEQFDGIGVGGPLADPTTAEAFTALVREQAR